MNAPSVSVPCLLRSRGGSVTILLAVALFDRGIGNAPSLPH